MPSPRPLRIGIARENLRPWRRTLRGSTGCGGARSLHALAPVTGEGRNASGTAPGTPPEGPAPGSARQVDAVQRAAQLAQLGLDPRLVLRAETDQDLLAGRGILQIRVRIVEHRPRSHQRDRRLWLRRLQQVVDRLDQPVVELALRIAEFAIGLLEQRVVAPIRGYEFGSVQL